MRLNVDESLFIPGSAKVPCGHLIWSRECPSICLERLTQDQGYPANCSVFDQGVERYNGPAFVKRRKRYGTRDVLVILLPDVDLGFLSADAFVDMRIDALA